MFAVSERRLDCRQRHNGEYEVVRAAEQHDRQRALPQIDKPHLQPMTIERSGCKGFCNFVVLFVNVTVEQRTMRKPVHQKEIPIGENKKKDELHK